LKRAPVAWTLAIAMIVVVAGGLALAARQWYPPVASEHGVGIQRMLDYTLVVTGVFFVLGHVVLAWLILRRPRGDEGIAPRRGWLVAFVPALVMAIVAEGGALVLAWPAWSRYYGAPPHDALTVEVTGRQFVWIFRQAGPDGRWGRTSVDRVTDENPLGLVAESPGAADDLVTLNEVWVPVGRPARLLIRSYDIIHSFFVPALRLKQDAMPGMTVPVWFRPTEEGTFEVACNQICGLGHYRMKGTLRVASDGDVARWVSEQ
jgi:cytochrome c oxidase subunit 2